jgi:hypothetical protein
MDIFQAIRDDDLDRVNQLLLQDHNLINSIEPEEGNTPLGLAAANNTVEIN